MRRAFRITMLVFAAVWFVLCSSFLVVHGRTKGDLYDDVEALPFAQVAVIPGSAVSSGGALSPVFKDRVDMALAIYRAGKVRKILVTGDNSTVGYNEVNPVRIYLIENGVPYENIFLDHAGFDTYSSMYRARDVFLAESMIVVTQSFHLARAVYTAKKLGIPAVGMNADSGHYLFRNHLREVLANVKTMGNLFFHTKPKYLGKEIPLTGIQDEN